MQNFEHRTSKHKERKEARRKSLCYRFLWLRLSPSTFVGFADVARFVYVHAVKLIATTVFLWKDFVDFGERTALKPTVLAVQSPFGFKNQRCFPEISTNHKIR